MISNKYFPVFSALILGFSGCASMVNKVDHEGIARVKTVAVIGMTYDQQAANSGSTILDNVIGKNDKGLMGKPIGEIIAPDYIAKAYGILTSNLETKKHWKFVPESTTIQNKEVAALYEKKNATIQAGVLPLMPHFYRYEIAGLPQSYNAKNADKAVLNQIAKELGADALIMLYAQTRLSQSSVLGVGVGAIGSITDLSLLVYDPKTSGFSVVLNESGDQAKTTDGQFMGFADKDSMNIQALQSYQSAVDKTLVEL